MAATREQLLRLRDPFPPEDVEWRVQSTGEKNGKVWARVLAYINNRAIMNRLDDAVGPENWQDDYRAGPAGGVLCGIGILCERTNANGEVIEPAWHWKWDGAENTDVEPVKGGLSGAEKRAGSKWGIGRYLHELEEGWAIVHDGGRFSAKTKDGKWFKWDPPTLPEWAVPKVPHATDAQMQRINALLGVVKNERVAAGVRNRIAGGLTRDAADDAIRFLEARAADESGEKSSGAAPVVPTSTPVESDETSQSSAAGGTSSPETKRPTYNDPSDPDTAIGPPRTAKPRAETTPAQAANPDGAKCPKCSGAMYDNRANKRNPKAPDFKCRDRSCDGVIWPAPAGRDAQGRNIAKVDPTAWTFPKKMPPQLRELGEARLLDVPSRRLTEAVEHLRIRGGPIADEWVERIEYVLEERRLRRDKGPAEGPPPSPGSHNRRGDLPDDPAVQAA